jgi:hypothetical protein
MILSDDLDEAMLKFDAMIAAYDKAIAEIDRELAAGRSGLTHYHQADELLQTINACAATLAERIDEARRLL